MVSWCLIGPREIMRCGECWSWCTLQAKAESLGKLVAKQQQVIAEHEARRNGCVEDSEESLTRMGRKSVL